MHRPQYTYLTENDIEDLNRVTSERSTSEGQVIKLLLQKQTTRSDTFYKVTWLGNPVIKISWERASNIKQNLVKEFENSENIQIDDIVSSGYAKISNSTVAKVQPEKEAKRCKYSSSSSQATSYLQSIDSNPPSQEEAVKCNTVKDKGSWLNHNTAGILAAAWPCGFIMLISELFRSESISQVYGNMHQFFCDHPKILSKLDYLCYDVGCYLHKYTHNPCRAHLTSTATNMTKLCIVIDKMHMKGHIIIPLAIAILLCHSYLLI